MTELSDRAMRAALYGLDDDPHIIADMQAEIELLRSENRQVRLENEQFRREIERLRALLKQARCPGGGWTGMPKDIEPTVGNCMAHDACGCDFGDALRQGAEPSRFLGQYTLEDMAKNA